MINGVTQNLTVLNYNPPYNTSINFRIENVGGREIFRYVVDNQSSPIGYSPTMPFNGGYPVTDSEHRLSCDSLWTDISGLQEQTNYNPVTWSTNYSDLECWRNDSVTGICISSARASLRLTRLMVAGATIARKSHRQGTGVHEAVYR